MRVMAKFDYGSTARIAPSAHKELRQGAPVAIVGITSERPEGGHFQRFPPGVVYHVEYADGVSADVHESDLSGEWPDGWWGIDEPEHRRLFAEELESELGEGHALNGVALEPIARADGVDDYLFQADDGRVAEVHLTFANRPERPPWPRHVIYPSLEAWLKAKQDEQHA